MVAINHPSPDERGLVSALRERWKQFRRRRIQHAIRSYNSDKHFRSPMFRPIAGPATMRMVHGEIERNKLPFHVDGGRPWLAHAPASPSSSESPSSAEDPGSALPASLRHRQPSSTETSEESPIILTT